MENAVILSTDVAVESGDVRRSAVRRALSFSVFILVLTVGLCSGLYCYQKKGLHDRAARVANDTSAPASAIRANLLSGIDELALSVTAMAILGGVGSLIPLYVAATSGQRRLISELEERVVDSKSTVARLQGLLSEIKSARDELATGHAELEEKVKSLTAANETLQGELNKRNQSERALTQRRQPSPRGMHCATLCQALHSCGLATGRTR